MYLHWCINAATLGAAAAAAAAEEGERSERSMNH